MSDATNSLSQSSPITFVSLFDQHVSVEETVQGYLQISLVHNGSVQIRGTRPLMNWLFNELAKDGWSVTLEDIRWCG